MENGGSKRWYLILIVTALLVSTLLTIYVLTLVIRLEEALDEQLITLVVSMDHPTATVARDAGTPVSMSSPRPTPTARIKRINCYVDGFYYPYC